MPFDFSSYLPPPPGQTGGPASTFSPQTMGALPTGITQQDIPQMQSLMFHPVTNPDEQIQRDGEGNVLGSFKDLSPDAYKTQKAQWNEQQKLIDAHLLQQQTTGNTSQGEAPTTYNQLGSAAPAQLSGHDSYSGSLGTNKGELGRLVYTGKLNDSTGDYTNKDQKLLNPSAVGTDPNWGQYTTAANIDHKDPGWDTFWKVAPMLPGLFAMGAPALFGGLTGAGGATAGAMIGDQSLSNIGGGAIAQGGSASAGSLLSNLPASFQKYFPQAVKQGIGQLNSNSKFDFSKYIPTGLQMIAKGLG